MVVKLWLYPPLGYMDCQFEWILFFLLPTAGIGTRDGVDGFIEEERGRRWVLCNKDKKERYPDEERKEEEKNNFYREIKSNSQLIKLNSASSSPCHLSAV